MTFLEAAAAVLSAGWSALSGLVYPGTSVSYAGIAIGALVAAISLRVAGHLVGVHYSFGYSYFPYPNTYKSGGDNQCPGQMKMF